jgi:hypothetical protein
MGDAIMAVRKQAVSPPARITPVPKGLLQRCEGVACPPGTCGHDEEQTLQRVTDRPTGPATVSPLAQEVLRSPGQAADTVAERPMESRSGHDFGRIRVHNDVQSGESARVVPARAMNEVPPIVHEVLHSPGQPLDRATRAFIEPRLGRDFSDVRVHTDAKAAESARTVNALAYTVGHDVVFSAGQYAPQTSEGRRLMAHELTHAAQQRGQGISSPKAISSPESAGEREATIAAETIGSERSFRPAEATGAGALVHRQPAPAAPAPAAPAPGGLVGLSATRDAFNNSGAPDPDNCAALVPAALGVDGPAVGQNGMEMIFRIHGPIPPGTEFDITRTKATGVWQEDGGAWSRLGGWPAGTSDDHIDDDECLTPAARRIFVVDIPGPHGTLDPTTVAFPNAAAVSATATALVWKLSFAEWVIARNRPLGIGWRAISTPLFHRWHSIFSVRLGGGVWTRVDTPGGEHNEIELGAIATAGAAP